MESASNELITQQEELKVADFLAEKLKELVQPETAKYLGISADFRKELETYSGNLQKAEGESSISLFLFGSLNTTSKILDLVRENIEETPAHHHPETLAAIKNGLLTRYNISLDGKSQSIPELFLKIFKKTPPADLTTPFSIDEMVLKSLEANKDKLNALFNSISVLLLKLWEVSKLMVQEVERFAGGDFKQTYSLLFKPAESFSEIIEFEEKIKKSEEEFLSSVRSDALNKQKNIETGKLPAPEGDRKNRGKYSFKNIFYSLDHLSARLKTLVYNWHNTFFVLTDDWMLELEIAHLKYFILKQHFDFDNFLEGKFLEPLTEQIGSMKKTVDEITALFNRDAKKTGLMEELKSKRTEVKRTLVLRTLPAIKKIILDSNIPARIDEFEQNTAAVFGKLSESRTIKKTTEYKNATESSELEKISPRSLVSFQMMPDFMKRFPLLKQSLIRHLQQLQTRIEEIPDIIDFSLISVQSYFVEKDNAAEAEKIGMEGMHRAMNKIEDIEKVMISFHEEELNKMNEGIEQLALHLQEITDNESALQIRMRIAKARAMEKSKQIRNKIFAAIRDLLPRVLTYLRSGLRFVRESSIRISKQFMMEDKRHFVATDVSDYLTETEKAINRLPFIYQRLFKTEPLTSFELFTERNEEIEQLKKAYSRWKDGKFAPTAIIAEKGWGKTTLLNRFLKMKLTTEEVKYISPDPESGMDELLATLFEIAPKEETAQKGQESPVKKKIVVIDGLEKLFEARIDGFDNMSKLLQHISDTNYYVFWIVTCHLYAWDYLEKILEIADFFGYHIKLSDLSDDTLTSTIEKRHNISGYRLMFLPDTEKKSLISFKKQRESESQEELKHQYFSRMHRIVRGNLSQAFLFWMRSTSKVTEDTVYIEYISNEYFNFLSSMTDSKLMILKNIVIHNGLTAQKHASLFRITPEKSQLLLQQLYDDGIVVKSGKVYNVNPIIYRQVISHLYLLNILH